MDNEYLLNFLKEKNRRLEFASFLSMLELQ